MTIKELLGLQKFTRFVPWVFIVDHVTGLDLHCSKDEEGYKNLIETHGSKIVKSYEIYCDEEGYDLNVYV